MKNVIKKKEMSFRDFDDGKTLFPVLGYGSNIFPIISTLGKFKLGIIVQLEKTNFSSLHLFPLLGPD